ncbi:hypothetical protein SLA2020_326000 [Shorea laevis]
MDGVNGYSRQGSGVWRSLRNGDFEEEDVWAVLKERKDYSPKVGQSMESAVSARRHFPSAARMIPKATSASAVAAATSSDSSSFCHEANGIRQQSAPVNIPNWSKISGKKSKKASSKNSSWLDDDDDDNDDNDGIVDDCGDSDDDGDNDDEDDEYNSKVPPHEILARRLARSQISSFSVFEGVGRKLKGRDLSKVRNAVLTKTGFLE